MGRRIVVTGIGIISPIGLSADTTWESLLAGRSGVDYISSFDPEPFETQIAAEVKGFESEQYFEPKQAKNLDHFVQYAIEIFAVIALKEVVHRENQRRGVNISGKIKVVLNVST